MSVLESLLEREPPKEIFHYTSQEGLLGILRNRELWASKAMFMNDTAEFQLALDLARAEIKQRSLEEGLCEQLLYETKSIEKVNVFVCSFSERGDLLSQWRGYTPPGAGYSIGFSSRLLRKAADDGLTFYLGKCTYDQGEHLAIIRELVSRAIHLHAQKGQPLAAGSSGTTHPVWEMDFQDALAFAAPLLKDPTFSEENEWRLVSRPIPYNNPNFSHRPGRSHLVPFVRVKLSAQKRPPLVRRIIIGPTPHPDLAEDATFTLLGSLGVHGCVLENSEIPFRSW